MAKQNKTFAQRAKEITKKYKRADWDPIERNALESALGKLQQEQEAFKQANQIGEYACGGKMHANGDYLDPIKPSLLETITPEDVAISPSYQQSMQQNMTNNNTLSTELSPYSTSITPQLISGATSVLGNLLLAGNQKPVDKLNLPRVASPLVNYEGARQSARRTAAEGLDRSKYAATRGARTRGEYLASRALAESDITGKLGEVLSGSKMQENLANANIKAGMSRENAQIAAKEQLYNLQMEEAAKREREAYLSAAIQTIPQMTSDISRQRSEDRLINILGDNYGWYMETDPNARWYQKKKSPVVKFRG